MQHGLGGDSVPSVVTCEVPVIDHGTKHGTGFPPVIWGRKIARYVAGNHTSIVLHHSFCDGPRVLFDVVHAGQVEGEGGVCMLST